MGIGSAGESEPSYSVRLPFTLSPGRTLKLGDDGQFNLLGQMCEITQEGDQYVLTIGRFDTKDAASTFLAKAAAGLIWFGLTKSVGFRFNPVPTPVFLFEQPKPIAEGSMIAPIARKKGWHEIDGHYDADKSTIKPEHKRLIKFAAGAVTVRLDTAVTMLSEAMRQGMGQGRPELVLRNSKLRLASEVYLSSHFENTPTASFLSRITTLEILVEDAPASGSVKTMVEGFIDDAKAEQKGEPNPEIQREFQSLVSRLNYLRNRSIKSGIQTLVEQNLRAETDSDEAAEVSREISQLYDLRSTLVHSGKVAEADIVQGNNRLNEVVPRILRVLFRETAR
jgi:hypothetical protein